jgi:hypothetical protein
VARGRVFDGPVRGWSFNDAGSSWHRYPDIFRKWGLSFLFSTWRFGSDDFDVGGFGSLEAFRAAYEKAGGRLRDEAFEWWTVARTLWWGLGLARQAQAYMDGAATSIVLAASGRRVVELEYDLLCLMED